jgi:hypothetical protein
VILLLVLIKSAVHDEDFGRDLHLDSARVHNETTAMLRLHATLRKDDAERHIAFAPDTPSVRHMVSTLQQWHPEVGALALVYPDENSIEKHIDSKAYGEASSTLLYAAVIVNRRAPAQWDIAIRMNGTNFPGSQDQQGTAMPWLPTVSKLNKGYLSKNWELYQQKGFLALQSFVQSYVLANSTGSTAAALNADANVLLQPFPTEAYRADRFVRYVKRFLGFLFTLAFIWPVTRCVKVRAISLLLLLLVSFLDVSRQSLLTHAHVHTTKSNNNNNNNTNNQSIDQSINQSIGNRVGKGAQNQRGHENHGTVQLDSVALVARAVPGGIRRDCGADCAHHGGQSVRAQ